MYSKQGRYIGSWYIILCDFLYLSVLQFYLNDKHPYEAGGHFHPLCFPGGRTGWRCP